MRPRPYWQEVIQKLLLSRSVLWVSGVRRVGKTTLCQSLPNISYFDCELPRIRQQLEDPEFFFRQHRAKTLVLDEIHRLTNPSEVLKIAADHFPKTKVIATGSSTLAARSKFRDTLAGRKHELWLLPAIAKDCEAFGIESIDRRMLNGGLPSFVLGKSVLDTEYQEWLNSYWARDLQELFVVDKRGSFFKFIELLFRQSGQLFEAQSFAAPCEISRQTVQNYLQILETTLMAIVLRPFAEGRAIEIRSQPKVYGFDTGFVGYFQGIESINETDRGFLFEHLVLNELTGGFPRTQIFFWRDKQKHEIDFILKPTRGRSVTAIECKLQGTKFAPDNLKIFRRLYPEGKNIVVCLDAEEQYQRNQETLKIHYVPFQKLLDVLTEQRKS